MHASMKAHQHCQVWMSAVLTVDWHTHDVMRVSTRLGQILSSWPMTGCQQCIDEVPLVMEAHQMHVSVSSIVLLSRPCWAFPMEQVLYRGRMHD